MTETPIQRMMEVMTSMLQEAQRREVELRAEIIDLRDDLVDARATPGASECIQVAAPVNRGLGSLGHHGAVLGQAAEWRTSGELGDLLGDDDGMHDKTAQDRE